MNKKIKIGIVGYGNLGKGVEKAIKHNLDMELEAIFTRRELKDVDEGNSKLVHISKLEMYKGVIDVMILCGGSATDLVEQGPMVASQFNTVDSFDTHARIPEYFEIVNSVAKQVGTVSLISTGWDPGLFSLNRLLGEVVLPQGVDYTFWGKGVSQGHSDAVRRIEGVKNAVQYTIPLEEALDRVRSGQNPKLTVREKHERVCYVVPCEGADLNKIECTIKNMPNYFSDYNTTVHFISEEEFKKEHTKMSHGGFVIRTATTGDGNKERMEFSLSLDSNPEFTSSVLVAYARGVYNLSKEGKYGAVTVFDVPFAYLSPKSPEELRKELL
ncbi:diaminopimelate dehydrogenase [Clostridium tetanomorphum]|uniref:Meso-diaminopimelate D-dehydrogenase n=1 Tax=Clostridium tetanomorphum TaxID=1553 RepID=A0A923E9Y7_CLOTT|nr:diaminopimelate dehydrogenase [Clostridium tetanomorphum]KAJ51264.1 meso-diaminopimelate dehydrogenase [Clostridium tetanomorphum DSM 665]MBC2397851.1 diaminopimelate dehydrogenase [Clostridium tetanomorphum]MBP1864836.1 diaminopimelate dehydrogenase [Clostridium tetanomorphum]NRS84012.1 diaminopimelate dehydrogenase [Clostridium tetanomorphum]NRZ97229.1 diaminopimelate dehydrogenase [Clostridium tetanomorphum]